jgi:hypothetical protein
LELKKGYLSWQKYVGERMIVIRHVSEWRFSLRMTTFLIMLGKRGFFSAKVGLISEVILTLVPFPAKSAKSFY